MGFWTAYAETPEEREWAERRDYEDYQAQRDAEDVAEKDRRMTELEAALSDLLKYADIGHRVEGVVYSCGTHADVIKRGHALLRKS